MTLIETFKTHMNNTVEILTESEFTDMAEIVDKFGQGCGKCVDGFQVDFDINVTLKSGNSKNFHIVFQSIDRSDNMRAYGSFEMTTGSKYGCDDDLEELLDFTDYDEEILEILQDKAEKLCKKWFDCNKGNENE